MDDYYPVAATPRWGHGAPAHGLINEVLSKNHKSYDERLAYFAGLGSLFTSIPLARPTGPGANLVPFWGNTWFTGLDAVSLLGMLVQLSPKQYFEIGSGYSTRFARHAIKHSNLKTRITSLDPSPRVEINTLCDNIIREGLENCSLSIFDELEDGDILLFDGSHRVFTNSDVTAFFLDVIPRLKRGVMIHVHDIYLPWDYPPEWQRRMYSEQYILAAMLTCGELPFDIVLPNFFVCKDAILGPKVKSLLDPLGCPLYGSSFWMRKL